MKRRVTSEFDLLDEDIRQQIITEIEENEERRRRTESYRRAKIMKDRTDLFVVHHMLQRFSRQTVNEMRFAISNISILRKIIDKLARVYADGVRRKGRNDAETETINEIEDVLNVNQNLKTTNKILKRDRNAALYIKPCPYIDREGNEKVRISLVPLSPYLYSVVEEPFDRTRPIAYVLSNFDPDLGFVDDIDEFTSAHRRSNPLIPEQGDGRDQIIADRKEDENKNENGDISPKKTYIWWSNNLHFTTQGSEIVDSKSKEKIEPVNAISDTSITIDERIQNPYDEIPIVDFAIDRDNSFWAEGGQDLSDGSVLINTLLTNMHSIGIDQGYGQLVITGKKLPDSIATGPTRAIKLEHEVDDPAPTANFISPNAPLADLSTQVKQYTAMLLSTNNLSTTSVAASLDPGVSAPSGVAMLIDRAESVEDVEDQREMFTDKEPKMWRVIAKMINMLKDDQLIQPELEDIQVMEDINPTIVFNQPKMIQSEAEKLENIQKRKDLDLNTMVDLMMMDNPNLTEEEAREKMAEILEEKNARMMEMMGQMEGEANGQMGHTHESSDGTRLPVDSVAPGAPHDHGGTVQSAPNNPGHVHLDLNSDSNTYGPEISANGNAGNEDESFGQ